jgi:hypothetical protein
MVAGGPAQSEFSLWRHAHFSAGELTDPEVSGAEADPMRAGVPNLLRYAFGLGPRDEASAVLPELESGPEGLRFVFRRLRDAADLETAVEQSDSLSAWRLPAGAPVLLGDAGGETQRWAQPVPLEGVRAQFRLSVKLR